MIEKNAKNTGRKKFNLSSLLSISGFGVVIAYILLCVLLTFLSRNFLTINNFITIIRQAVWVGVMGIGMTFVIATGGIDLSVGSTLGFAGLTVAVLLQKGIEVFPACLIAMLIGAFIGLINGLLISKVKLPAFIATLGTMSILRGLVYVYTKGIPVYGLRYPAFQYLAQGYFYGIPFPVILMAVLLLIFSFLMYRTKFGRYVLAIGSNEDGARLVGIDIDKIKIWVYILTGFLCSISGILLTSRSEAAVADAGSGYEMDAIAASVIGGTSMSGGKANLPAMFLGAVLMTTIRNGLNLTGVSSLWHQVVLGFVILIAVTMDSLSTRLLRKE